MILGMKITSASQARAASHTRTACSTMGWHQKLQQVSRRFVSAPSLYRSACCT